MPTTGPGTAGALARKAVDTGADLVLACGGDGTLNETLQGMVGASPPLGILPAGTANVLAVELGLPRGIAKAAERIRELDPVRVAVGRVTCAGAAPRYFLLMAGAGLDARIVYHVSAGLKSRTGKLAYWAAGFGVAGRLLPHFRVECEGRAYECSFALASRVRNYGGTFEIARGADLFSGCFEAVLFRGRFPLRYLVYLAAVALKRAAWAPGVTVLPARRLELSCPSAQSVYVQVDGEFAGRLPATVEIVPSAVNLLVPHSQD